MTSYCDLRRDAYNFRALKILRGAISNIRISTGAFLPHLKQVRWLEESPVPQTQNGMAPDLSQCESAGATLKKESRKTSSR